MTQHVHVRVSMRNQRALLKLRDAFEGMIAERAAVRSRDDVLIATALGWYLRRIDEDYRPFFAAVLREYKRRRQHEALSTIRAMRTGLNFGLPDVYLSRNHLFTFSGITAETKGAIAEAAETVRAAIAGLQEAGITWVDLALERELFGIDDTTLTLLVIWWRLRRLEEIAPVETPRPTVILFEIEQRGRYREEHKLFGSPRVPKQRSHGPLTCSQRITFRRNWRDSISDVDTWGDDAIMLAILHGG